MRILILLAIALGMTQSFGADAPANVNASELKKVFDAFSAGRSEFYAGGSKTASCTKFSNWDKTYCMDGFYFASHESALSRPLAKIKETLPEYIEKSAPKESLARQSFFRSLGLGIAQFGIDPSKLAEDLAPLNENDQLFVIDGWGAGQYHRFGYLQARQNCAAAPEKLRSGCYWGMGRGFLLTGIPAGSSLIFDDNFVAGYLFTRSLLQPQLLDIKAIQKIGVHATQAGEFFKFFVAKGVELKKAMPKVTDCFTQMHFTKCLQDL